MSFNDLGVTNAIVWWRGDVRHAARTATTLALATSSLLYLLCFFGAPFIASELGSGSATGVLRLLSLTVIVDGISSVPIGLLNREFRQDRRAFADWFGFVLSTGLTVGLALAGFGAWSLAWGRLAGNLVTTTSLFFLAHHKPRPGWDREVARKLLGYGLPLAGSSILVFLFLNLDYMVVGHVLGAAALGIYTIAFNLASWPSNVLSATFRRVSIPAFAHLQHDATALRRDLSGRASGTSCWSPCPCAPGSAAWPSPSSPCSTRPTTPRPPRCSPGWPCSERARVYLDFSYDLLSGTGRTLPLFLLQALWVILLLPALVIGANARGVGGVAAAHVIVAFVVMVPMYTFVISRRGPSARSVLVHLARPLGAAILAGVVATIVTRQTSPAFVALLAGGFALVAIYGLLAAKWSELWSLPKRLLRFEAAPA